MNLKKRAVLIGLFFAGVTPALAQEEFESAIQGTDFIEYYQIAEFDFMARPIEFRAAGSDALEDKRFLNAREDVQERLGAHIPGSPQPAIVSFNVRMPF